MRKFSRWIGGAAAMAVLAMAAMTGAARIASAQEKKVKDQAEYDLFDAVKKDIIAKNGAKALR